LPAARDRPGGILAIGTVLAFLYLARDVLVPITLAVMLSLLVSPLVRGLRRIGVGATSSALAAALVLALACASLAAVLGVQVVRMAASLPQYEDTIRHKLVQLNEMTVDRVSRVTAQAGRMLGEQFAQPEATGTATGAADREAAMERAKTGAAKAVSKAATAPVAANGRDLNPAPSPERALAPTAASPAAPIPVEVHKPPPSSLEVIEKVLATLWTPLAGAGIVLMVLVFLLLEHEAVRDRFIRTVGGTDVRATTLALNDAGERLSRFFVSQFAVNFGVGVLVWIGLAIIGLPQAALWGALATSLRFVPYIGVWIAAALSTLLAAAVDPGWLLAIETLGLFVIVELIASQLIEPQLYGHSTGLSPLSVVISAIFWGWLWGPVGLVMSTPLTLCLVVAGRHVKALSALDLLLSDAQALTLSQRFYQRALSADSAEIIESAREYLKRNSFAAYCDRVLMPALHLAFLDLACGAISGEQQIKVRSTVVAVVAALAGDSRKLPWRRNRDSVLDQMNAGRQLRQQREEVSGRWQGPLAVPPGSVMLCVSLGSMSDDLATELLVRILREQKVDARHVSLEDLRQPPSEASPGIVAMVYLVSAYPNEERKGAESAAAEIRARFPSVPLVTVFLRGMLLQPAAAIDTIRGADQAAASFGEALQIGLGWFQDHLNT